MTTSEISTATEADITEAANLVAEAFFDLDVCAWLVPDPVRRREILPVYFAILTEYAFAHGEIHFTGADRDGVGIWVRHGPDPLPDPQDYDARLRAACGECTERFQILDEQFEVNHPHGVPHHHLALLAVRPGQQGKGIGTTLLAHHHEYLDANGIGGYLEASSLRSRALYERHGYVYSGTPIVLPDGPNMWPMWREPS